MPELLCLLTLVVCSVTILFMLKFFEKSGLYVYSAIAVVASNIQVLKLTKYYLVAEPVALGTVLFSTTFAVDNILNEYFGENAAKKGIWMNFSICLFFAIVMHIAITHPPVIQGDCINLHVELRKMFSPTFALLASSLIAYIISKYTDVLLFSALKKTFSGKYLGMRSLISTTASTFIDNSIFSILAWIVFSDNPIPLSKLWMTYIFISSIIRLSIAAMCAPLVKLAGNFVVKKKVQTLDVGVV